jgi:hypothetical protein
MFSWCTSRKVLVADDLIKVSNDPAKIGQSKNDEAYLLANLRFDAH